VGVEQPQIGAAEIHRTTRRGMILRRWESSRPFLRLSQNSTSLADSPAASCASEEMIRNRRKDGPCRRKVERTPRRPRRCPRSHGERVTTNEFQDAGIGRRLCANRRGTPQHSSTHKTTRQTVNAERTLVLSPTLVIVDMIP
jgi:hypothetical protein